MTIPNWLRSRQTRRFMVIAILAVIAGLTGRVGDRITDPDRSPMPAGDTVEGRPNLVDGDSFHLGRYEVRLKGIDAPEGRQICRREGRDWRCGDAARAELQRLVSGQSIICKVAERDQHGRLLAYCSAGSRDLNAGMVASGMALSYGAYLKEETAARLARRGLWASEFQRPREWRRQHGIGG